VTDADRPEHRLVADLERRQHPELASLRRSIALGGYLLGRLSLPDATDLSGLTLGGFEDLVEQSGGRGPEDPGARRSARPLLSVVVPVLDEQATIAALHEELSGVLAGLGSHEVIFVDDGSRDASADVVLSLRERDPSVKLVRLSRNFGHQAALTAGLDHARGRAVVFMDADLQDPPALLGTMVERWREGNDVVYAVRTRRKESRPKRAAYWLFYRLFRRLAEMEMPLDAGDYCLIDERVARVVRSLPERNRFLRGLRSWAGFRQVGVPYDRPARRAGQPKYTLPRLVRLAVDGLLAFSSVPLRLASWLGFLTAAAGVVYVMIAVVAKVFVGHVPSGWTSIIAIVLTVGGAQLLLTGLLGAYLARVYDETKGRPPYVTSEVHGLGPDR
jgi:glycosyltransferase involved in cell wall biosynthesis